MTGYSWNLGDYAASLARQSDSQQTSIQDQHDMNREGAAQLLGLPIPTDAEFDDIESRTTGMSRRADWLALARRVEDPHCRVVVIWDDSRVLGDEQQVMDIDPALAENNVQLFTKDGREIDVSTSEGFLVGLIMGWRNKQEVVKTRKRVKDTHRVKAKKGRLISRIPYTIRAVPLVDAECGGACRGDLEKCKEIRTEMGLDELSRHGELSKKNTVWVINRTEHERLTFMFQCLADGYTWGQIADRLLARDWVKTLRTIRRSKTNIGKVVGGTPFEKTDIQRIVANPFYKGDFTWGRREVRRKRDVETRTEKLTLTPLPEDEWVVEDHRIGALIPPELHDQAMRAAKLLSGKHEDRIYPPLLFDDIVYCGRCGWKMYPRQNEYIGRSGIPTYNYYCGSLTSKGYGCKKSHSIAQNILDWHVLGLHRSYQGRKIPDCDIEVIDGGSATDASLELDAIERRLKDLDSEENRIDTIFRKGRKSEAWYDEEIASLDTARERIRIEQQRIISLPTVVPVRGSVPEEVQRLMRILRDDGVPMPERQTSLRRLVDRIIVDRPSIRIVLREQPSQPQ